MLLVRVPVVVERTLPATEGAPLLIVPDVEGGRAELVVDLIVSEADGILVLDVTESLFEVRSLSDLGFIDGREEGVGAGALAFPPPQTPLTIDLAAAPKKPKREPFTGAGLPNKI